MPKIEITDELAEEIKACFVEGEFNSRMELIKAYHEAGGLMQGIEHTDLQALAKRIGRSDRTLYYAVKFYQMYPDLNMLPEGKNTSMNKIITKYLTTPKEKQGHEHSWITICSVCHEKKPSSETGELQSLTGGQSNSNINRI